MRKIAIAFAAVLLIPNWVCAQNKTRDGAVIGGVTGAVIGGVVGKQNKKTTEGALIGGAVGAVAGGVVGHQRDKQIARERQYQHEIAMQRQQLDAHQQALAQSQFRGVTVSEILQLSRNGVSDQVIVNHVLREGVDRPLEIADIIHLHQQGVSEVVISAMQRASTNRFSSVTTYPSPYPQGTSTVIVREGGPSVYSQQRVYHYPPHTYRSYPSHYYRPF